MRVRALRQRAVIARCRARAMAADAPATAVAPTAPPPRVKQLTLMLLHTDGQVLLGMKKRGFGAGKVSWRARGLPMRWSMSSRQAAGPYVNPAPGYGDVVRFT